MTETLSEATSALIDLGVAGVAIVALAWAFWQAVKRAQTQVDGRVQDLKDELEYERKKDRREPPE